MLWRLSVEGYEDGKFYIFHCPALDIIVQGNTKEKAQENMEAALNLFLIHSTFDEVMNHLILIPPSQHSPPDPATSPTHQLPARGAVELAYAS